MRERRSDGMRRSARRKRPEGAAVGWAAAVDTLAAEPLPVTPEEDAAVARRPPASGPSSVPGRSPGITWRSIDPRERGESRGSEWVRIRTIRDQDAPEFVRPYREIPTGRAARRRSLDAG